MAGTSAVPGWGAVNLRGRSSGGVPSPIYVLIVPRGRGHVVGEPPPREGGAAWRGKEPQRPKRRGRPIADGRAWLSSANKRLYVGCDTTQLFAGLDRH